MWGLIGVVIGVLIGWGLCEITKRRQEEQNVNRLIESVRELIGIEIEKNIAWVEGYWEHVMPPGSEDIAGRDFDAEVFRLVSRATDITLPTFSHRLWESQMSHLPTALNEKEMKGLIDFYEKLGEIQFVYSELLKLKYEDTISLDPGFDRTKKIERSSLFSDLKGAVEALLKSGNPIADR
jgi:hypothetical protein